MSVLTFESLSCRDIARVFECRETSVTRMLRPGLIKFGRMYRRWPQETVRGIVVASKQIQPISPEELDLRIRIRTGRVNRWELRP